MIVGSRPWRTSSLRMSGATEGSPQTRCALLRVARGLGRCQPKVLASSRGDGDTVALIKRELQARRVPWTHGAVVGQVWRGGSGRQAQLTRFLPALDVAALDASLGRRAGVLLGRSRTSDVVDAALVLLAADGDLV